MGDECLAALQRIVVDVATRHRCPSVSWGVVADGVLAHHGVVGSLDDGSMPTERTVYRIASMTKSFTAATVLALRDEGLWSLDDPVARHAPELSNVTGPQGSPAITLRHLLSMTSGLTTDDPWADRHLDFTAAEIDQVFVSGPTFSHRPNTAYEYSNLGFAMIGRAIERATGVRAQQHIAERFLQPLGLHDTSWIQPGHDNWARPYRVEDQNIVRDTPDPIGDGELAPMGGLWSTVADLAKWIAWFDVATTSPEHDGIGLSASSRIEMQRVHTYIGISTVGGRACPAGYGFGLNVRHDPTLGKIVAHAGGLPGYGSNMRWFAGRGMGVVALANTFYAPMSELTMRLLVALHEHNAVPSAPTPFASTWKAMAKRLIDLLNDWDDSVANDLFEDNVMLDDSIERRRAQARALVTTHGKLRITHLRPVSEANGDIDVGGTGSAIRIYFELSPSSKPRVQAYTIHQ